MRSTMEEVPLSIATIVRYGTTVHGTSEVITSTWTFASSLTGPYNCRRYATNATTVPMLMSPWITSQPPYR